VEPIRNKKISRLLEWKNDFSQFFFGFFGFYKFTAFMKPILFIPAAFLFGCILAACAGSAPGSQMKKGAIESHRDFPSQFIAPRNVDVYLPPGYAENTDKKYPVLYMHDGQNLFSPGSAFGGAEWQVDEVVERLLKADSIRPAIVLGIWNTPRRFAEYMPQEPYNAFRDSLKEIFRAEYGATPLSDAYLKFLVEELKPFIDRNYRTLPATKDTYIAGSSMGGLVSLYAICRYPEVFGRAACLSTHWPVSLQGRHPIMPQTLIGYFGENLPGPATHRIYFDFGTETLDSLYEPYQLMMDEKMRAAGYAEDDNWLTRKFPGAEHSEKSWAERLHVPLEFLLGKE